MDEGMERRQEDLEYLEHEEQPGADWKMEADRIRREDRKLFGRIGAAYAMFLAVTMAAQAGFASLFYLGVIPEQFSTANFAVLMSMASMYFIAFPIFWLMVKRIPKSEDVEQHPWSLTSLVVVLLICLATIYIGNIIGQLLMFLVSLITGEPMVNNLQELIMNMDLPVIFFFTVIVAPIMEELTYRKLLIDRIRQYGDGVCIVLSGVLFGLAHGNFYQFFYAFALGVIFAYIYIWSGRIQYTIGYHMIINFLGGVFPMLLLRLMKKEIFLGSLVTMTFGLFVLGFLGVGTALFIMNFKKIDLRPGRCQIPRGRRFQTVVVNAGMLIYVVVCGVMFAIS